MIDRLLRGVGVVALLAVAVALLAGGTQPRGVRAEQFVLVDAGDRVRARLGFDEADQPALQLYNDQGQALARLGVAETQEGAVLSLSSRGAAGPWVSLAVLGDESRLSLYGGAEWPHGIVLSVEEGLPCLALHDETGAPRALLRLQAEGAVLEFPAGSAGAGSEAP